MVYLRALKSGRKLIAFEQVHLHKFKRLKILFLHAFTYEMLTYEQCIPAVITYKLHSHTCHCNDVVIQNHVNIPILSRQEI